MPKVNKNHKAKEKQKMKQPSLKPFRPIALNG